MHARGVFNRCRLRSLAAHQQGSSSLMASSQAPCIRAAARICENEARFCGAECALRTSGV